MKYRVAAFAFSVGLLTSLVAPDLAFSKNNDLGLTNGTSQKSSMASEPDLSTYIQLAQAVTGNNVTKVWYPSGTFTKTGGNAWVEKSKDGTFNYVEVARDVQQVILRDIRRDITIILALGTMQVGIVEGAGYQRPLYRITKLKGGSKKSTSTASGGAKKPAGHHCHNRVKRHRHAGFGKTTHSHYQKNCEINILNQRNSGNGSEENCVKIGLLRICK